MSNNTENIFIVGAARSGTHLLSSLLRSRIDCAYAGEINDVWRRAAAVKHGHDMIPASSAGSVNRAVMHNFFDTLRHSERKAVVLEKTAANSLRMPFLYRLFPHAAYIHIIRDGRDVAVSARKKYLGDIRKITRTSSQKQLSKAHRLKYIATIVRHKFSTGITPEQLLHDIGRYSSGVLSTMGVTRYSFWGPRFPGMKELMNSHAPLEVAGMQWRASMEAIANFVDADRPMRWMELKFEDLINSPVAKLEEILVFLGDDVPLLRDDGYSDIVPFKLGSSWRDVLRQDELADLHELILSMLLRYDYAVSDEN